MAEEGAVERQEAPAMDDFSRTMGQNLGESTPEPEATPDANSTPAFDWSTVNLETVDVNTIPEGSDRQAAIRAQDRIREMSSGVGKKLTEVSNYENDLKAMREELEAFKNPPAPQYEPGKADYVAEKLGYDLNNASPAARDSFNVVNSIVEGHPLIEELRNEIASLKEQVGPASQYVQRVQDGEIESEFQSAVEKYGQDVVDKHLEAANTLRGMTLDGVTYDFSTAIGRLSGMSAKEAADIDAKSKAAKNGAIGRASGVSTVPGGEGDLSNSEIDKQIHKLLS